MKKSLDTNILVYAINLDCNENKKAKAVYNDIVENPEDWIIPDQVYFELYQALRNPKIFEEPLTANQALAQVRFLREELGLIPCSYSSNQWKQLIPYLEHNQFKALAIFDLILATTLNKNGVDIFYTRNTKDFSSYHFFQITNPID